MEYNQNVSKSKFISYFQQGNSVPQFTCYLVILGLSKIS